MNKLHSAAALALAFLCLGFSSCSFFLSETAVKRPDLHNGLDRGAVIAKLGQPKKTQLFQPPRVANSLSEAPRAMGAARVGRQDEYSISGLVQLEGDRYESDNSLYPVMVIMTGGLSEVVMLPFVSGDLATKAVARHRLLLWYDAHQKLLQFERKK